jgi:hypothetical protein
VPSARRVSFAGRDASPRRRPPWTLQRSAPAALGGIGKSEAGVPPSSRLPALISTVHTASRILPQACTWLVPVLVLSWCCLVRGGSLLTHEMPLFLCFSYPPPSTSISIPDSALPPGSAGKACDSSVRLLVARTPTAAPMVPPITPIADPHHGPKSGLTQTTLVTNTHGPPLLAFGQGHRY